MKVMVRQDKRLILKDGGKLCGIWNCLVGPGVTCKKYNLPEFYSSDFINFVGNVLLWNPSISSELTPLSKFRYFWFYARLILLTLARE